MTIPNYTIYKKPTLDLKIHIDWKNIFHANSNQISREAIFREKSCKVKNCHKMQRRTLYNGERVNPPGRYNNYKYICTQHQNT